MDYWIFHDWHPLLWVTSRRLCTLLPSQSPPPVTRGLTNTASTPGARTYPDGRGAVTQPHSFLRNRLGKERRGRKCGNSPRGRSPALSPSLGSSGTLRPALGPVGFFASEEERGRATPAEAKGAPNTFSLIGLQSLYPSTSNGSARGTRWRSRRLAVRGRFH